MSGLFLLDTKVRDFSENRTIPPHKKCKAGYPFEETFEEMPRLVSVAHRHKAYSS